MIASYNWNFFDQRLSAKFGCARTNMQQGLPPLLTVLPNIRPLTSRRLTPYLVRVAERFVGRPWDPRTWEACCRGRRDQDVSPPMPPPVGMIAGGSHWGPVVVHG